MLTIPSATSSSSSSKPARPFPFLTVPDLTGHMVLWLNTKSLCAWGRVCKKQRVWFEAWLKVNNVWVAVEKGYHSLLQLHILRSPKTNQITLFLHAMKYGRARTMRQLLKLNTDPKNYTYIYDKTRSVDVSLLPTLVHWGVKLEGDVAEANKALEPVKTLHEKYTSLILGLADLRRPLLLPFHAKKIPGYMFSLPAHKQDVTEHIVKWLGAKSLASFTHVCKAHLAWLHPFSRAMDAAQKDYPGIVKAYLRRNPKIITRSFYPSLEERSLLSSALTGGCVKTTRVLLKAGISQPMLWREIQMGIGDPNTNETLGHVRGNHVEMMHSLLHWGADINYNELFNDKQTALIKVLRAAHPDLPTIRFLLDNKANVHAVDNAGHTPMTLAASHGHIDALKLILQNHPSTLDSRYQGGQTLLMLAAATGQEETVRFLLEHRPHDIEARDDAGNTALMHVIKGHSSREKKEAVIQILLAHATPANIKTCDDQGRCVIYKYLSNVNGINQAFLKFLIDQGAELHPPSESIPSELDTFFFHMPTLLDLGAKLNVCSKTQRTMLMCALEAGKVEAVRLLLSKGVDLDAVDVYGRKALNYLNHAQPYERHNRQPILRLFTWERLKRKVRAEKVSLTGHSVMLLGGIAAMCRASSPFLKVAGAIAAIYASIKIYQNMKINIDVV